jgi:hypothetical protein
VECSYHLPHLCDCGSTETENSSTENVVQEELLEVPDDKKPDPKTPDDEELTPAEEKKFSKYLNKFLEEDDTPSGTQAHTPTPTTSNPTSSLNIAEEINKALDARESRKSQDDTIGKLRADVDALKPKAKKWHQPWTLFSG